MKLFKKKEVESPGRRTPEVNNAPVFSYYANRSRSEETTGRYQTAVNLPAKRHKWRFLPSIVAVAVIFYSLSYVVWLDTTPRLDIVTADNGPTMLQNEEVYQKAAQEILSSSFLNRIKLTINTDTVAESFKSKFPELAEVVITTPIAGHRLVFKIQPTLPKLVLSSDSAGSYILDDRGRAVVRAQDVPDLGELKLPVVFDQSEINIQTGKSILTAENTEFILAIAAHLKAKKHTVDKLILPRIANELHVQMRGHSYIVKFNMGGDPRLQVGTFLATKKRLEATNKLPKSYIDARVEGKAFYR